jgi:hypothetical protein
MCRKVVATPKRSNPNHVESINNEHDSHQRGVWDIIHVVDLSPGAIGFDRMATVAVACRGRLVGLFNHPGKQNC